MMPLIPLIFSFICFTRSISEFLTKNFTVFKGFFFFSYLLALNLLSIFIFQAFTIIVMFNIFPPNISLLPIAVRGVSESRNAMKRLKVCFVFPWCSCGVCSIMIIQLMFSDSVIF